MIEIPRLTSNSLFALALGLLTVAGGAYMCLHSWTRTTGIGLLLIGFGVASLGFTNGFADQSPLGKLLYRLSLVALGVGIPTILYGLYSGRF